ncbi:hypothetical protein Tco_0808185 [Tanacetum coccineum]
MDNVPSTPHDSPLLGGHTPGSDKGRLQQDQLTDIVTSLSQKGLEDELKFQKSKSKRRRLILVTSEDEEDLVAEGGIDIIWKLKKVLVIIKKDTYRDQKSAAKDKGKAKMDETESPRKMKQKERAQISRDEEVAQKLQEEFDAAERQRMA